MTSNFFENESLENQIFEEQSICDCTYEECNFLNCVFDSCEFKHVKFYDCTFYNCRVRTPLIIHASYMKNCEFIDCQLIGIEWSMFQMSDYVLPVNRIENCLLKYNNFNKMNFRNFSFKSNDIEESLFVDCNLIDSNFQGCKLDDTEYIRCDLQGANFKNAEGYMVDVLSCKLKNAVFSMPDAMSLLSSLNIKIK